MAKLKNFPGLARRLASDPELGRLREAFEASKYRQASLAAQSGSSTRHVCSVLQGRYRQSPVRQRLTKILLSPPKSESAMNPGPTNVVPMPALSKAGVSSEVSDAFRRSWELRDNLVRSGLHLDSVACEIGCAREALIGVVCGHGEWGELHDKVQAFLIYAVARTEHARLVAAQENLVWARRRWAEVAGLVADIPTRALRDEGQLVA